MLKAGTASRILMGTCSIISSCGDVVDCDYSKSLRMNRLNPKRPFETEMEEAPNESIGSVFYVSQETRPSRASHIHSSQL